MNLRRFSFLAEKEVVTSLQMAVGMVLPGSLNKINSPSDTVKLIETLQMQIQNLNKEAQPYRKTRS